MFFSAMILLHVVFAALFLGSAAALALLWGRSRSGEGGHSGPLFLSQKLVVMAGSMVLLLGILLLIDRPQIMQIGPLFHTKLLVALISVGLAHMGHSAMRKVAGGEEGATGRARMAITATPLLAAVALALAYAALHLQ